MRVVVPLVSAASNISGVQRHAINLARALLRNPEITSLHLIAGPWQQYVLSALPSDSRLYVEFPPVKNTVVGRNLWYATDLPLLCRELHADVVHFAYPVPVRRSAFSAPLIVSLHDLYPHDLPENFGLLKAVFNRAILRQCLKAVDKIVCVSESTLERLDSLMPRLSLTSAIAIPNCVEPSEALPVRPSQLSTTDRFLLCVGQHRRNKNLLLLLKAYCALLHSNALQENTRLVIVGIEGPETSAIQHFIQENALGQSVVLLKGLSEGELQWCYQHCNMLVAPSSVEGFGLPLAEGLMAGCRIVCSNIPSFREIGGRHCRYVSLADDAVTCLANAIAEQSAVAKPTPVTLSHFSIEAVGGKYAALYGALRSTTPSASQPRVTSAHRHKRRELEV